MAQLAQARPVAPPVPLVEAETEEKSTTPLPATSSIGDQIDATTSSRENLIRQAVERVDLEHLRSMADEPGGYETDELRRLVWPLILGCDIEGKRKGDDKSLEELPAREDERQVKLDIARSLINYPPNVSERERDDLRLRLERAILTVLRKHPALQYFQGYHDIVSILLLTLDDDDLLASTTEQMSLHRIRDSMGPGLEPTLGYLKLAHRLIQRVDPEMYSLVNQAASMPFFALSWALTLFSHDLYEVAVIARLFDFLLAHNPAMISYLVVAILLTKKEDLVECLDQEDNDPAMVHSVLSQLPNLVLSEAPRPLTPGSPRATTKRTEEEYRSEAESETLFSSPSASTSDLSSQLTSVNSSSTLDVSESIISLSEASPPPTSSSSSNSALESYPSGLRHRRTTNRRSERFSFSSFDSDINAFEDSMLSDPDVENLAFSAFPTTTTTTSQSQSYSSSSRSITPPPPPPPPPLHQKSSSSPSPRRNEEFDDTSNVPPPRTVLVEDLIQSALKLYRTYPLTSSSSTTTTTTSCHLSTSIDSTILNHHHSSSSNENDNDKEKEEDKPFSCASSCCYSSIEADKILGPKSCIFTYESSILGILKDEQAEEICKLGQEIINLEALLPDPPPPEEDDGDEVEEEEEEEEDGFELVGGGGDKSKDKRKKKKKKSLTPSGTGASSINGRINLGPHGWLVVGGVAVATAAVAYGVYGGGRVGGATTTIRGNIGTGGLGLRTGFGGIGGVKPPITPSSQDTTEFFKKLS
ncbi:hypothetical protein JCM3765_002578 [Sporobolomyces pararoseus]